ncbi:TWiK family of potassium channels protein 7 isoform X2 [Neodiprion pinetum]|uniref:TWiK family of potassium channels protein 7 isoform X2 n=1 Tax=Neodiprion pinetum TaxID=441929 RepID=UPI001EDF70F8|nr:potassium channel subfamily K member 9 isoform X2 [Neodiprion pinetum]
MSNSPKVRQLPPRPRITLPVPGQYMGYPQTPMAYVGTPYGQSPIPVTPIAGTPHVMYANKASEFMFTQFKGIKDWTKSGLSVGEKSAFWLYEKVSSWSKRWFTHIFLFLIVFLYSVVGAVVFVEVEGSNENKQREMLRKHRNETVQSIRGLCDNVDLRRKDALVWDGNVVKELQEYEDYVIEFSKSGFTSTLNDRGEEEKIWTFWNAIFYCGTIYTTIGYGDIAPKTQAGKAITIVYAIFGIPMFLIILADFGKLFTRGMKFLWAFVRRVYYTGSCRKVRRTGPVQEVMKGVQLVYDFATFRRPSQMNPEEVEEIQRQQTQTILNLDGNLPQPETPGTPAMSNFVIDDEFNLPISVAISILLGYIFVGATVYQISEGWGFFESFYFVFISMSTIGFGDYVPQNSLVKMLSLVYLFFGLALTSMCINVVQVMLSDSFKKASQKIGASIGFEVAATDGAEGAVVEVLGEDDPVGEVQVTVKEFESQEEIAAPKAKPEVDDL